MVLTFNSIVYQQYVIAFENLRTALINMFIKLRQGTVLFIARYKYNANYELYLSRNKNQNIGKTVPPPELY